MKGLVLLLFWCFVSCLAGPTPREAAACIESECLIQNNCKCSSDRNPIGNLESSPQLIAITVSESIVTTLYNEYLRPLFFHRTNPDGNPIGLTFFVNHEYTDYTLVQDLYLRGYEIGVHSLTKNPSQSYWQSATYQDLIEEFAGQKQILSAFANIPSADVVGGRTPQLQIEGDRSIDAYIQSGLIYDNSWPTTSSRRLLPYTLDYRSTQPCQVTISCPEESHPGFWIAPLTDIRGKDNVECNSLATCLVNGTAQEIASWLMSELNKVRSSNRAPLTLRLDSYWFEFFDTSYDGFTLFLDQIRQLDDVFLVSVKEVIDWMKNPVTASNFRTATYDRQAACSPVNCELKNQENQYRYMKSCVPCPDVYPWKGNPYGEI